MNESIHSQGLRRCGIMLLTWAMLSSTALPGWADDAAAPSDTSQLKEMIGAGIKLLEAKKYEAFLQRYPVPAEREKMLKERSLEEMARSFSKRHAERLLAIFRQIEGEVPTFSEDGQRADYKVNLENFSRDRLVFEKIDGHWYLRN